MSEVATAPQPLSILTDEEVMFRDAVRDFAEAEVRPYVHEMDEAAKFRPEIIAKFFEMGFMGIEVPEAWGGSNGSIFLATLAIEELARVDASAAIYVDVHNTLVNNAILRWATEEQKARFFPRMTSDLPGRQGREPDPLSLPENVAPGVLYMVSDLAADHSGKVLGVSSRGVREIKMLQTRGFNPGRPYTAQEVAEHAHEVFFPKETEREVPLSAAAPAA